MSDTRATQHQAQSRRISLFDSHGMPWTSHLSMGGVLFAFILTGGLAAIPIGLCLGIWVRTKTKSPISLSVYAILTLVSAAAFLPDSMMTQHRADFVGVTIVVLWFGGALIARHQIARYYLQQEGQEFHLSLLYTLLFGVWYLNYRIRPEFPTDVTSDLPLARS